MQPWIWDEEQAVRFQPWTSNDANTKGNKKYEAGRVIEAAVCRPYHSWDWWWLLHPLCVLVWNEADEIRWNEDQKHGLCWQKSTFESFIHIHIETSTCRLPHTNMSTRVHIVAGGEKPHCETGGNPQTQQLIKRTLTFSRSSLGVCAVFMSRCHPVGIPSFGFDPNLWQVSINTSSSASQDFSFLPFLLWRFFKDAQFPWKLRNRCFVEIDDSSITLSEHFQTAPSNLQYTMSFFVCNLDVLLFNELCSFSLNSHLHIHFVEYISFMSFFKVLFFLLEDYFIFLKISTFFCVLELLWNTPNLCWRAQLNGIQFIIHIIYNSTFTYVKFKHWFILKGNINK